MIRSLCHVIVILNILATVCLANALDRDSAKDFLEPQSSITAFRQGARGLYGLRSPDAQKMLRSLISLRRY
ncbi:hypothetical protein AB6A40_010073 [Gnathostoma spinigerum]|uniref:Uncharacterized protein n=1 Tax=Gnathostoma spinigerum TaxID=75299 RepID=A0ABD6EYZ2_9BILA